MEEIKKNASFKTKQRGKDVQFNIDLKFSSEYDSFIIKIKEGEGFMSNTSNIERMPLKVVEKLNEMLDDVLIKAGSKTEIKKNKMYDGGNFQSGVYAGGGSLKAHGIEAGDTFLTTISGNIQKVKDKNGKIVYINLSNGERDTQPPLPFKNGGALIGNQKRIDMNKNGKIDAEDFKLLRSSMNGAWRNEQKHVNHNEDYEVRYARKKPSRAGYKGKRKFGEGGGVDIGYNVFNYTDNIYATDEVFKTKALANKFIKEFRSRFANQGYYRDFRMNKINIEDIDLLAIPSNFNPLRKYNEGGCTTKSMKSN